METYKFKLTDIPRQANYEGYLWWSNADSPKVYKNKTLPEWPGENANPFIIEGQLFDIEGDKSYAIRYVDGQYLVNYFDLIVLKKFEYISKEYLPNRIEGVTKLCFREYWRQEQDSLCEGMQVLKPAENVFVGFNKCKED